MRNMSLNNMSKNSIVIKWLLIALLVVAIATLLYFASAKSPDSDIVVREYNGQVAIFRGGRSEPDEVFDTYVSSLPKPDIEELKDGIKVKDEDELQRLIEDLTS